MVSRCILLIFRWYKCIKRQLDSIKDLCNLCTKVTIKLLDLGNIINTLWLYSNLILRNLIGNCKHRFSLCFFCELLYSLQTYMVVDFTLGLQIWDRVIPVSGLKNSVRLVLHSSSDYHVWVLSELPRWKLCLFLWNKMDKK